MNFYISDYNNPKGLDYMDFSRIKKCGIVPVIKIDEVGKAVPLAKALLDGGIDVMEITFRTEAAADAIKAVSEEVPGMHVGAGTVLTVEQLKRAKASGACFIVSPGFVPDVVKTAIYENLPVLPGIVTPSEICAGLALGISVFKFFPAENYGGLSTLKALAAPFGGISFVPTGGISERNAADYFRFGRVLAVGGSWMAPDALISSGDFAEITRRSREAVELMNSCRI